MSFGGNFGNLYDSISRFHNIVYTKAYIVFDGKDIAWRQQRSNIDSQTTLSHRILLPFKLSNKNNQMGTCPSELLFATFISLYFCYHSGHLYRLPSS